MKYAQNLHIVKATGDEAVLRCDVCGAERDLHENQEFPATCASCGAPRCEDCACMVQCAQSPREGWPRSTVENFFTNGFVRWLHDMPESERRAIDESTAESIADHRQFKTWEEQAQAYREGRHPSQLRRAAR